MKVVITRSKEGNRVLGSRLKSLGISPLPFDGLSFEPPTDWSRLDARLKNLKSFDWIIFTSAVGAKYFESRMKKLGLWIKGTRPRVAAVGARTASALRQRGIRVDFVPQEYLTATLGRELPKGHGSKVLLLRANIASPELARVLREREFEVEEAAIYSTNHEEVREVSERLVDADLITFASPSAVRNFCDQTPTEVLSRIKSEVPAICIGPVTARSAQQLGFRVRSFPKTHTIEGMVREIGRFNAHA